MSTIVDVRRLKVNLLNAESNSICLLLALLGAHHILHVSRIRVNQIILLLLLLLTLLFCVSFVISLCTVKLALK